jgi:hypothetical protein
MPSWANVMDELTASSNRSRNSPAHIIFCRQGRPVQFCEADLKTPLPRTRSRSQTRRRFASWHPAAKPGATRSAGRCSSGRSRTGGRLLLAADARAVREAEADLATLGMRDGNSQ